MLVVLALGWLGGLTVTADLYPNLRGVLGELGFDVVLSAVFAFLALGVVRRWRWMFYLLLVLFLPNGLSVVELIQERTRSTVLLGLGVSLPAFLTGLAMIVGLRKSGVWGAF